MLKFLQKPNIIILLVSIVSILILFRFFSMSKKIVYVDNNKLFENFNMTKELKKSGEREFQFKKAVTDSLYTKLQHPDLSSSDKKIVMQEFLFQKEELERFNQYFAVEQSSKIWARIKSYSSEFAKENKYQLVIGSDNKANVLFADEEIDVTNNLLIYINKKYEGLK